MSEMQTLKDFYIRRKKFAGYIETIVQYTSNNENIIVNKHKNDYMNFHMHDFFEFNYLFKGECNNLFESGSVNMQAGDFIIITPDAMHSLFVDNNSLMYNFLVSKNFLFELFSKIMDCENTVLLEFIKKIKKENSPFYIHIKASDETSRILSNIINVNEQINKPLVLEALVTELILAVAQDKDNSVLSTSTIEGKNILKNILTKMETDYQTVSLDTIAKDFGYSKAHLCKLFKKHYNRTFQTKLNEIRILHAKKLLSDTNMPITDISYKIGFESIEYFYRLFKKSCGQTPNNYRNKVRNERTIKEEE